MTAEHTKDLLARAVELLSEARKLYFPSTEWNKSVDSLLNEYQNDKIEESPTRLDLAYKKPVCEHVYSKAMGQRYPRRCVKCSEKEQV